MFASGPISADFALELTKLIDLHRAGLARTVLRNELMRIEQGTFDGFGTNKTTIEIVDNDLFVSELMIIRGAEEELKDTIQSMAYETCMLLVCGEVDVFEYEIDEEGEIAGSPVKVVAPGDNLYLFAKTSDSRKLYRYIPCEEVCFLISATWKRNPDDYYVTYDRGSLQRTEAVSTNSTESRVQFWLTFCNELRADLSPDLIARLHDQAETTKLKKYLADLLNA